MKTRLTAFLLSLLLPLCALAEDVPYRQRVLSPDELIFSAPSYDAACVATVQEAGVYTIVEEQEDGEGRLWGRLKSGAGWLDLTHVRQEAAQPSPVTVTPADVGLRHGDTCRICLMDDAESATWLLLRAAEPLTDVRLMAMDMVDVGWQPGEILLEATDMASEEALLAALVFYGDMTLYGLQFTDAAGQSRFFTISISGRNGLPVLTEWEMKPMTIRSVGEAHSSPDSRRNSTTPSAMASANCR